MSRLTDLTPPLSPRDLVRAYHDRTKHHPGRYARSLGYLDWDQQPDPFRRWTGAALVPLDLVPATAQPAYESAWVHGQVPARPLDRAAISQLFMDALALSAWKKAGDQRWPLRVEPSSGNLHPTEGWLLAPAIDGLTATPAIHHYSPYLHALEERALLRQEEWAALTRGLPEHTVLVGLSSAWWRESWKYGERAFRYCQHDLGHCIGTLAIAAAGLGWRATLLEGATDDALRVLLGLHHWPAGWPIEEQEQPEAILAISPSQLDGAGWRLAPALVEALEPPQRWRGTPSLLSEEHQAWPVIDQVHRATAKQGYSTQPYGAVHDRQIVHSGLQIGTAPLALRQIVHQRRSAVSMDAATGISREAFLQIVRKLLPGPDQVPWTTLPWRPRVHPVFFVHRVADLAPGLYGLARDGDIPRLCGALDPAFRSTAVTEDLPLVLLQEGDCRALAQGLSCGQDIASDGVFAVAMLGELAGVLESWGPWAYKRLHWEAGLLGQVLYLEAEATGVRATGIGCFFDDPTHQQLLSPDAWRSDHLVDLYHFTVGGPVEDTRLQTLPAYAHRDAALAEAKPSSSAAARPHGRAPAR